MTSSHSFSQQGIPVNSAPALAPACLLDTVMATQLPNYAEPSTRRTRKELFVDGDYIVHSEITYSYRQNGGTTSLVPVPSPSPPLHGVESHNLAEASHDYVDPMDLWRTYTKRSIDDRHGRAPLTCIWKVGTSEEGSVECGYGATPKLMRRHVQTTHMHIKRYRCDICDQAFSQGALLHSHKASKHAQTRPYKCPFEGCDKAYVDCPTLLRHKKINHNYIPKPITRYR